MRLSRTRWKCAVALLLLLLAALAERSTAAAGLSSRALAAAEEKGPGPAAEPTAASDGSSAEGAAGDGASLSPAAEVQPEPSGWQFEELPAIASQAGNQTSASQPQGLPANASQPANDTSVWQFEELPGAPSPPKVAAPSAPAAEAPPQYAFAIFPPPQEQAQAAAQAQAPPQTVITSPVVSVSAPNATVPAPVPAPPAPRAAQPELPTQQPSCRVQWQVDFHGGDMDGPNGINSTNGTECCQACIQQPGCGAWTFSNNQKKCWLKHPVGWDRLTGKPDLVSGIVTAVTVMSFNVSQELANHDPRESSPLQLPGMDSQKPTTPPPPGQPQGMCMVLPNRNPQGKDIGEVNDTTAADCCAKCAATPSCTVWNYCPNPDGCKDGYRPEPYPAFACGLRYQENVPTSDINPSAIDWYSQGSYDIPGYPTGYTVPFIAGYVIRPEASGSGGSSTGAIIGAVVGGVAAAVLAAGLLWWRRQWRRRQTKKWKEDRPEVFAEKFNGTLNELEAAWPKEKRSPGDSPPNTGGTGDHHSGSALLGTEARRQSSGTAVASTSFVTQGTAGSSGPIPELPFASALLSPSDYSVDTDPSTGKPVLIGSGHFANVYRGKCGMEPAAIKVIKDPGEVDSEQLLREVAILKSCRSQHLVSFLGAYMSPTEVVIVTELMSAGSLWRALKSGKVSWYRRGLKIAIDVARGLDYLHRRNIVHLDLKSPNVLLTEHGKAKVGDVGLARMVPATQSCIAGSVAMGSFPWSAPEQLFGQRCTIKADIYAYGVLLWEICTALTPVRGHMRDLSVPEECPQLVANLYAACTSNTPEQRPSAEQIINALTTLLVPAPAPPPSPAAGTRPAAGTGAGTEARAAAGAGASVAGGAAAAAGSASAAAAGSASAAAAGSAPAAAALGRVMLQQSMQSSVEAQLQEVPVAERHDSATSEHAR